MPSSSPASFASSIYAPSTCIRSTASAPSPVCRTAASRAVGQQTSTAVSKPPTSRIRWAESMSPAIISANPVVSSAASLPPLVLPPGLGPPPSQTCTNLSTSSIAFASRICFRMRERAHCRARKWRPLGVPRTAPERPGPPAFARDPARPPRSSPPPLAEDTARRVKSTSTFIGAPPPSLPPLR